MTDTKDASAATQTLSASTAETKDTGVATQTLPANLERLDFILLILLLVLTFLVGSFAAVNSDVWMNLASGRLIAQGEWNIGVDPFSFATEAIATRAAIPWVQHSWLYSLLLYWLYNLVGGGGLVVLKALAVVALAWCLLQIPGGKRFRLMSIVYVGLAILTISPQLILRPVTISFLLYGVTLLICYRAGALGNVPPKPKLLWWLPLLFLLWANLDAWFIMGPLTLALLWAGSGMGFVLGIRATFPGKTLGAVLGVGLLACLVNPHHVEVFMLPPELANVLILWIPDDLLPDALFVGGKALRNLRAVDPNLFPQFSPFSLRYRGNPFASEGPLIAGMCYYPLLLLGIISFIVNAAVTRKPGAPGLHPGRFLVFCIPAVLSAINIRFIPWFAIVAAPVTVLNLVDWRTWLTNIQVSPRRSLYLGRALMFVVGLVLLFLAWPGWLHTAPGNFSASQRVAWKMPEDPSYQRAALRLRELNEGNKGLRVFNFSPDIAHYCAWHAPGVKCFFDARWSLFPEDAVLSAKARFGLTANMPEVWLKTFQDRKVNYLAAGRLNFLSNADVELAARFWQDETHWDQKYNDGRMLLFAWSGTDKFKSGSARAELARRAFGKVPESERAPMQAPPWPTEDPSLWRLYTEGLRPLPLPALEATAWLNYHQVMARIWHLPFFEVSMVAQGAVPAGLGHGSVTIPFLFGSMDAFPSVLSTSRLRNNNKPVLRARDPGSPAALVLMMRCARRAFAENPDNPTVYLALHDACSAMWNELEEHWANYNGDPRLVGGMRQAIRRIQIYTALKTYLDLHPDDFRMQELMGQLLLQRNFLDVGLDHLQLAAFYLDQNYPKLTDPKTRDYIKSHLDGLNKKVKSLQDEVKNRHESFLLEASAKKGLDKYFVAMNRGLAKDGLEQLRIKIDDLQPKLQEARDYLLARQLLDMGQANVLTESIAKTGPGFAEFRALHAAALGNYADLDKALAQLEETEKIKGPQMQSLAVTEFVGLNLGQTGQLPLIARSTVALLGLQRAIDLWSEPVGQMLMLRGIMALEQGDTAAAKKHLEAAWLWIGHDVMFADRPIVERYLELLRAAEK